MTTPEFESLVQEATDENTSIERLQELACRHKLARLIASNSSSPELLAELASSSDTITRQNVTANPNTTTEVLLQLGQEFPGELYNNPIFSLLLLENPNFLTEAPYETLVSLVRYESKIICVTDIEENADSISDCYSIAKSENFFIRRFLAKQPNTNCFILEMLAEDRNTEIRKIVACNSNTPKSALKKLAEDSCKQVRLAVVQNPYTPSYLLEEIALTNKKNEIRACVAANPNTPTRLLQKFAEDKTWRIRQGVARNPRTSVNLLEKLALDNDSNVKSEIARNPKTPLYLLEKLARDSQSSVRHGVAENPSTPVEVLKKLAREYHSLVSKSAKNNLNDRKNS